MPTSREESLNLLNDTHDFPTYIMFKVIGKNVDGFSARVVACIRDTLQLEVDPHFRSRTTKGERHISITVEPEVQTAEQVLAVYGELRTIEGVVLLL
jgi:putative lipoic acid-binding regulatory protein